MESEWVHAGSIADADLAFAFNDSNFSDMVLRLEIVGDSIHPQPDSEISDRARVRRRQDVKKGNDNTRMKELQDDFKRNSDTIEKYYSDLQAQIDRLELANTSRFERMEAINTANEYKFNLINKALETLLQRNTPFQGSSHGAMNSNKHQPFQVRNGKLDFPRFDVVDHAALPAEGQILKRNQTNMADCVASENKDKEAVAMIEESPSIVDHAAEPDGHILKGNQPDMDDCVASENKDKKVVAMVEEFPSAALFDQQILNGKQPDMDECVASENKDEKVVAMVEESPSVVDHAAVPDGLILKGNQPDMDDCVSSENKDKEAVAMVEESPSVADQSALSDQQILNGKQPDMDECVASENKDEKVVAMVEESPSVVDHAALSDGQILKRNQPNKADCVASENKDKDVVAMVEESPSVVDHAAMPGQQILNWKQPVMDDCVASKNKDERVVAMVEESSFGDGAVNSNDSNESMDYSAVAGVRTLHISSRILGDKSPFFCKLFSNGMRGPEQRCVTLRIDASEEAALMELLKFTYSGTLSVNTETGLLEVLLAANKFEVASCMIYCSQLLQNMAITPESALLYLELPSSVSMADVVQPLTDAANQYLVGLYKDITKYQEEVMNLPLAGVEAILSSDDLLVASEDVVYDFVLKWARKHYRNLEERQEVLGARLARLIRFPYMTCRKLKKVLTCSDFDHDVAFNHVLEALFFKVDAPHPQWSVAAEESAFLSRAFVERAYKYRRVKVVKLKLPRQQCEVYLDIKREECANLFPSGRLYSEAFKLGGKGFFLSAHCSMDKQGPFIDEQGSFHCFGLFLGMQEKGSVNFTVDYEFAARLRPTEEFVSTYKGTYTYTGGKAVGYKNLFAIPWTSFMAEDCLYFINGVLHLRAVLTIGH